MPYNSAEQEKGSGGCREQAVRVVREGPSDVAREPRPHECLQNRPQVEETAHRKGIWPGHLSPTKKGDKGQQRRAESCWGHLTQARRPWSGTSDFCSTCKRVLEINKEPVTKTPTCAELSKHDALGINPLRDTPKSKEVGTGVAPKGFHRITSRGCLFGAQ